MSFYFIRAYHARACVEVIARATLSRARMYLAPREYQVYNAHGAACFSFSAAPPPPLGLWFGRRVYVQRGSALSSNVTDADVL